MVLIQENHTTDNYFSGLAGFGANVATGWPVQVNPPASDLPHDRAAYYRWLSGQGTAAHTAFDTLAVLPYYAYLAMTGAFLENHCSGFGTNSTANHLLLLGGSRRRCAIRRSRTRRRCGTCPSCRGWPTSTGWAGFRRRRNRRPPPGRCHRRRGNHPCRSARCCCGTGAPCHRRTTPPFKPSRPGRSPAAGADPRADQDQDAEDQREDGPLGVVMSVVRQPAGDE